MIFGIFASLAGIFGMLALGLYLGPAAIVVGAIGLIRSLNMGPTPVIMNILGVIFGLIALLFAPIETGPDSTSAAMIASSPSSLQSTQLPPLIPTSPAPGEIAVNAIPLAPVANENHMGDFGDLDIIDISLTLGDLMDPMTGLQPAYIEAINKSNVTYSNIALVIGLKDQGLWPQSVLAQLKLFNPKTLPPGMLLKFVNAPFQPLHVIEIGSLPPNSSRRVTLSLNPYNPATFASNLYVVRVDRTGTTLPMAWLINGKIQP